MFKKLSILLIILLFILMVGCNPNKDKKEDIETKDPIEDDPIVEPDPKKEPDPVVENPSTFRNKGENTSYEVLINSSSLKVSTKMSFNFKPLDFCQNITSLNQDLVWFSFITCLDSHDYCLVKTSDMTNTLETNNTAWCEHLGFDHVEQYYIKSDVETEVNDTTTMLIAGGIVDKDNILINLSFQGTQGNNEWISNTDVGADTIEYYNLYGTPTNWKNKLNHKGFEVASVLSLNKIKEFIDANYQDNTQKITFIVNGYSRGAAIANIVGAKLIDQELDIKNNYQSIACTFATPNTTCSEDYNNVKYNSIYNFINEDDLVPCIPPYNLGFNRYGITKSSSMINNADLKQAYYNLTKTNYTNTTSFSNLAESLGDFAESREDIYHIKTEKDKCIVVTNDNPNTLSTYHDSRIKQLTDLGLIDYCYVSDVAYNQETGLFEYYYSYSLCVILEIIPKIISAMANNQTSQLFNYLLIFDADIYKPFTQSLIGLVGGTNSLGLPHYPQCYLLIIKDIINNNINNKQE